jgi:hypothetical protein
LLPDYFVGGGKANKSGKAFNGNGVAIGYELAYRLLHRAKLASIHFLSQVSDVILPD